MNGHEILLDKMIDIEKMRCVVKKDGRDNLFLLNMTTGERVGELFFYKETECCFLYRFLYKDLITDIRHYYYIRIYKHGEDVELEEVSNSSSLKERSKSMML